MEFHNPFKDIFFKADSPTVNPVTQTIEYVENPPTDFADQEVKARLEMDPTKTVEQVAIDAALRYADAADPQSAVALLHVAGVDTATKLEIGILAIEQQLESVNAGGEFAVSLNPKQVEESLSLYTQALEQIEFESSDDIATNETDYPAREEIVLISNQRPNMAENAMYPVSIAAGDY